MMMSIGVPPWASRSEAGLWIGARVGKEEGLEGRLVVRVVMAHFYRREARGTGKDSGVDLKHSVTRDLARWRGVVWAICSACAGTACHLNWRWVEFLHPGVYRATAVHSVGVACGGFAALTRVVVLRKEGGVQGVCSWAVIWMMLGEASGKVG